MALIPFPNVPNAPGVPQLPRVAGGAAFAQGTLALAQGALWRVLQTQSQWGIFDANGKPLADPDQFTGTSGALLNAAGFGRTVSTGAVDFAKEMRVSDFPVERGEFASYNKVETPANPLVTLCMSGSESERTKFLNAIDAATKSTALFSVVTPEVTYINYSVDRYNYQRRHDRGANLLMVEISLKEVREVSAQYSVSNKGNVSTPKEAGATPQVDSGKVQAQAPRESVLKSASKKLSALFGG